MHERTFHGDPAKLRSSGRVALLEVDRTVELVLSGVDVRSALDVGTGSGIFAEAFVARGLAVTGVDLNPAMIELARRHAPAADFIQAEFDAMPLEDKSFDLAFYGHALHESQDPIRTLAEARRIARTRVAVLEWPYCEGQMGPPTAHRLSVQDVRSAAQAAGLGDVEVHQLDHMVLFLIPV